MPINLSDPIWTIEHVAAAFDLSVDTAHEHTYRPGFPVPKDGFSKNLWRREDVLAWFAELPGRPRRRSRPTNTAGAATGAATGSMQPGTAAARPASPAAPGVRSYKPRSR